MTAKIPVTLNEHHFYEVKLEGYSKLSPFEALYLVELGLNQVQEECLAKTGYKGIIHAETRLDFIKDLIELENTHPDWTFDDFELYIRKNYHFEKLVK